MLKETLGVMVYQEQVMQISSNVDRAVTRWVAQILLRARNGKERCVRKWKSTDGRSSWRVRR